MENLKSTNKEETENTSKMLWESWIIDSTIEEELQYEEQNHDEDF
jgi:hypothetical protein